MSADELRMEQIKVLFAYGDDDAQEIARAELISGMLPLEEAIPYLDLASCVRPSQHVRRTVGIARRARVHRTRWSVVRQQQIRSWAALQSLGRFICKAMRLQKTNTERATNAYY